MSQTPKQQAGSNRSGVAPPVADELTALRAIAEGTAHSIGDEFFQRLVRHLARALEVNYAFVAEFAPPETTARARTLAYWCTDRIAENIEWALAGTPCEGVVRGKLCHYPSGVRQNFPNDRSPVERHIESYLDMQPVLLKEAASESAQAASFSWHPDPSAVSYKG